MILPVQFCRSTSQKCMEQKLLTSSRTAKSVGSTSQKCMEQKKMPHLILLIPKAKHFTEVHGAEAHLATGAVIPPNEALHRSAWSRSAPSAHRPPPYCRSTSQKCMEQKKSFIAVCLQGVRSTFQFFSKTPPALQLGEFFTPLLTIIFYVCRIQSNYNCRRYSQKGG